MATRIEKDGLGEIEVPEEAYYGAQTQRAAENFPVSGRGFPPHFIKGARSGKRMRCRCKPGTGLPPAEIVSAVESAAHEVAEGKLDSQFVLDVFQTGSGTSTNMNANEVIASRANRLLRAERREIARSSQRPRKPRSIDNDVIPTVIHIAAVMVIRNRLIPALEGLMENLRRKADEFQDVVKIGRTHLQDAVPVRLGQEFGGYARQVELGIQRAGKAADSLSELALGGTAVGNGINTHPEFAKRVIALVSEKTGLSLREAENHFEAQAAQDSSVEASGEMKTIAVSLLKMANDIRLMASGPRCGLGGISLPSLQLGSSIMPGKINPVMPEMVVQVAAQVIGNDAAITACGQGSYFELNTMLPVIARNLLESIELLASAARLFSEKCVDGITANREKCRSHIEQSLALSTYLVLFIGYDRATDLSRKAFATGKTVREVALEDGLLSPEKLDEIFREIG